jgi:hypothetical protein
MTTSTDILDLAPNVGTVQSSVDFELLDADLNFLQYISPASDSSPTITVDSTSTTKRTLSGIEFGLDETQLIDVLGMRLRPSWVVVTPDGRKSRYPLGVFMFSDVNKNRYTYGRTMKTSLRDQTVILDQGCETNCSVERGEDISTAIEGFAAEVGVSPPLIDLDFTSASVTTGIGWRVGTTRFQIISDLCTLAGYYPPYFNNAGVLRCRLAPTTLAGLLTDHHYNAGRASRIVTGTLVESDDLIEAPNRYFVINNSSTAGEISGYYDLPASAPQSYANRGYYVTKRIDAQGIQSSSQAVQLAKLSANTDYSNYEWVQFDSTPDPRHDIFDTVEYLGANYREIGWTLRLQPGGPHGHKLRKLYE